MNNKLVHSINPFPSVIQTRYDILKAHGGEFMMGSYEVVGATFDILLPSSAQYKLTLFNKNS